MANLAESAVKTRESWAEVRIGKPKLRVKRLDLTLSGQGGTTNKILATTLKFGKIIESGDAVKLDNSGVLPTSPSYDGSMLLIKAAGTATPTDVSGIYSVIVKGTPQISS